MLVRWKDAEVTYSCACAPRLLVPSRVHDLLGAPVSFLNQPALRISLDCLHLPVDQSLCISSHSEWLQEWPSAQLPSMAPITIALPASSSFSRTYRSSKRYSRGHRQRTNQWRLSNRSGASCDFEWSTLPQCRSRTPLQACTCRIQRT